MPTKQRTGRQPKAGDGGGMFFAAQDDARRLKCPRCKAFADIFIGYDVQAGTIREATTVFHCTAECGEPPFDLPDPVLDRDAGILNIPDTPPSADAARWYPQEAA
jgi:hypothetical protein